MTTHRRSRLPKELKEKQRRRDRRGSFTEHLLSDTAPFDGAVALAPIHGPEGQYGSSKIRPVVLCRQDGDRWMTWGLTSLDRYKDGKRRIRARRLTDVGLGPGYVWGKTLIRVPADDIVGVVWAAPVELLESCVETGTRIKGWSDPAGWVREVHEDHSAAGWWWPKEVDR